jgi:hypothetical protein
MLRSGLGPFACNALSKVGRRSIGGGVLVGRGISSGVGGKSTRVEWLVCD